MSVFNVASTTVGIATIGPGNLYAIGNSIEVLGASRAIFVNHTDNSFAIQGIVAGETNAIGTIGGAGLGVTVGASGMLVSQDGAAILAADPRVTIFNDGLIVSEAVAAIQVGLEDLLVENAGEIRTAGVGVMPMGSGGEGRIANTGTISGGFAGIQNMATGGFLSVTNAGTIDGGSFGILGSAALELVSNTGLIVGGVVLGDGADAYIGERDGLVSGIVNGGPGGDLLMGADRFDRLFGGSGNDLLSGGRGDDILNGDEGADQILDGPGQDTVRGGDGNDIVEAAADGANDRFDGGTGVADRLDYSADVGGIRLNAGNGYAVGPGIGLDGIRGFERLETGAGDDVVMGTAATRLMVLGDGDDVASGGAGNQRILGGGGDDLIRGDAGNDTLEGQGGDDTLNGGPGFDTFVFADGLGRDTIFDFNAAAPGEKIDLSGVSAIVNFADLTNNHLVQQGPNVLITLGPDRITLLGVNVGDLDPGDFVF